MTYVSRKKAGILLAVLAAMVFAGSTGGARAERANSVTSRGWEIVWNSAEATARHIKSGKTVTLYRDEMTLDQGDWSGTNYTMLSVVGTIVSFSRQTSSGSGPKLTFGTTYRAIDLSKLKPKKIKENSADLPDANLAKLFGKKAVYRSLIADPTIRAALDGKFVKDGGSAPSDANPKSLKRLIPAADGGCRVSMGSALLSDFRFSYRLGGMVAVVQVGLTAGCEKMRSEFTRLDRLYFPIPKKFREDFEQAVKIGALEDRPFHKPSYDCSKAGTPVEFAICGNAKLAGIDVKMAARYGELRAKNPGDKTVKTEQVAWVKRRNAACAGGNVACLLESYEKRLAELK